jgi:quinol monooxygenase YgiN
VSFVVIAKWAARAGEEEAVAQAITALIQPSRAEPGMILYQPHRDPDDPRVFLFYEQYCTPEDFDLHLASSHFQQFGFGEALPRLEHRERATYETWDGSS